MMKPFKTFHPFKLGVIMRAIRSIWAPSTLFANPAVNGLWLDPSDLTTMFQDSAGTTPVTAVEQPVGLIRDKSGRNNHAFQSTNANRPTLSARYNLLTKTEQFDDAAWQTFNITKTTNQTAPDGTNTAVAVSGNTGTTFKFFSQDTVSPAATSFARIYVKRGTADFIQILFTNASATSYANFNISTGAFGNYSGGTPTIAQSEYPGWWVITYTDTTLTANNQLRICLIDSATSGRNPPNTTGTGSFYIWHPQIVPANQSSLPYQRVNTATDYDSGATKFPWYLKFNGTSSSMQTASINFTATDKMFVSAGVRKLADNAGLVYEFSNSFGTNNGSFATQAGVDQDVSVGPYWNFASKGTTGFKEAASSASYAAPITGVISGVSDISNDKVILRINGAQSSINTGDQGTGTYGNYPLYIGARAGTSGFFSGYLYPLVIAGKQASTEEITSTETYINSKTKAY